MCGIAGVIGKMARTDGESAVAGMVSALYHRGPDDNGSQSWMFGENLVALGNTRLSILDLSAAGHQPMAESTGRYWIVFNGEIYNFQELRRLLDPNDRLFRTGSDTETILHAYKRWGCDAFRLLRGMFALALLDTQARVLHLVRDPLGIKPLYYSSTGATLQFASEVQALLASGKVQRRINTESIAHYLSCGWAGKSQTAIEGIQLLQPGHMLTVDLSQDTMKSSITCYEPEALPGDKGAPKDRNESTAHMLHLLRQSVKCHLVSDVPVGLFLSGGIDSTAILHLMRNAGCESPKTFTVFFPEEDFSERHFAKSVAERYDADHTELELAESDLVAQLPAALAAMDQPTMDGVNTFVIAKAVHMAGIKVALSGLGSDELFAGYPSFRRVRQARTVAKVPYALRSGFVAAVKRLRETPRYEKVWDLLGSDCTPQSAYSISRRLFGPSEIALLSGGELPPDEPVAERFTGDEINEMSRLEIRGYMTDLLLRDTDFMSMASSLEVRVPFVDKIVVRHALHMPGQWKIAHAKPKPLLLDAMRGSIPDYVWNRRKMGFVLPFDRWMRSTLRHDVETTLTDRRLAAAVGLVPDALIHVWRRYLAGAIRWSKPWSLFVLLRWCERQQASI